MAETLEKLAELIKKRKNLDKSESYVAKIFAKGREKIAQKVGEEGVEVVIAALAESKTHLIEESADLLFHLLMLLEERGVSIGDVYEELEKRMKK